LFPINIRGLETRLSFFNYYYKFIEYYIIITRPLIKLKIEGFKGSLNKGGAKKKLR